MCALYLYRYLRQKIIKINSYKRDINARVSVGNNNNNNNIIYTLFIRIY